MTVSLAGGEEFCGGNYLLPVMADSKVLASKTITLPYPGTT